MPLRVVPNESMGKGPREGRAVMDDTAENRLHVEVVYARSGEHVLVALELAQGSTVGDAITHRSIVERMPALNPVEGRVGIFGKVARLDTVLRDGDRIEIYRPLLADPGEARRRRVRSRR